MKFKYMLLMLLLFSACVDDDTVNEFSELNEVVFEDLKDSYSVMLYDNLKIPLNLKTTMNDESQLSFLWYVYELNDRYEADTLSRERDLDIIIDPMVVIPGMEYYLTVKVTDETTGVYYRKRMRLEVKSQFTNGTVLLCKENGDAELNFLTWDEERQLIENIYSRSNGGKVVGKNPLRIFNMDPMRFKPEMKQELILCEDENGGSITSPVSFEQVNTVRSFILADLPAGKIQPQLYFSGGFFCDYLMANGLVFKRPFNSGELFWEDPMLVTQGVPTYYAAPFYLKVNGKYTFYDSMNGRLLQHYNSMMSALHEMDIKNGDLTKFDPNHLGENLEMLTCGNYKDRNSHWMLMRNTTTNSIYLYKFRIDKGMFFSQCKLELTDAIAPNIANAKFFSADLDYPNFLIYSDGKKVYSLAVGPLDENNKVMSEAVQVDLSDKDMDITGFKFIKIRKPTGVPGRFSNTYQLRLFVKDNSLSELQGGILFYDVSTLNGIHSTLEYSRIGDFCDEVVDVDEKYS